MFTLTTLIALFSLPALADPSVASSGGEGDDTSDGPRSIYGGHEVADGRWPDTAALMEDDSPFCTGTLIAPKAVLTAAHCVEDGKPDAVVLGTTGIDGGERIRVTRALGYPTPYRDYDLAVLILERAATTEPRVMATPCVFDGTLADGGQVDIVGYGVTDNDEDNTDKHEVSTVIVDEDCSDLESYDCTVAVSPGGEMVAGGDGLDSCYGDSGGPVYFTDDSGTYLVGVTSRGATDDEDCGFAGIYVRPDAIFGWIEAQTGTTLPRPACDEGGEFEVGPPATDATHGVDSDQWFDDGLDGSEDERPREGCGCASTSTIPMSAGLFGMLALVGASGTRRRRG